MFEYILALGTNKSLVETKSELIVGVGLIPKVLGKRLTLVDLFTSVLNPKIVVVPAIVALWEPIIVKQSWWT